VERLGYPVERGPRGLVPVRAQKARGCACELVHRLALSLRRLAQGAHLATSGEELRLRELELVARVEQGGDRGPLGADELVDRPRRDRRLAERGDACRLVLSPVAAQRLRERSALGDEAIEGQAVEVAGVGHGQRVILCRTSESKRAESNDSYLSPTALSGS